MLIALFAVFITACSPSSDDNSAKTQAITEQARKDLLAEQAAEKARQDQEKTQQDAAISQAVSSAKKEFAAEQRSAAARANKSQQNSANTTAPQPSTCSNCGVVISVSEYKEVGKGSGLGVIAGGVVGGLLGNQVGKGSGRDVATVAGVVGGAYAGNEIEKRTRKTTNYEIVLKMDTGEELTVRQATNPQVTKGDSVRIENEVVVKK